MNNVIYEDNHLLIVEKPRNILVQGDETKDTDLLSELKLYIKDKYNKPGNVYLGLVHRLDRPVGGVMVFAKTSKAAGRISDMVRTHQFKKTYLAIVEGKVPDDGIFEDNLLKLEKENRTIVDKKGKYAKLSYKLIKYIDGLSLVKINLETGRSHQIRVQFSSRGFPLWAYKIEFKHPITKEKEVFKCEPFWNEYPWILFGSDNFE